MSTERDESRFRAYLNASMEEVDVLDLACGRVSVFTTPRVGREGPNEDSALVAELGPDEAVLCVADGVGGQRDGEVASRWAIEALIASLREGDDRARDAIMDAFDSAQRRIIARGVGAATTLAGVHIRGEYLRSFHVGDSQVLVMGQRGRRKLLTPAHSPIGYAVESGLMEEEEAILHEGLHLVSNLVGATGASIEISAAIRLSARDTVVIATDGLFDNLLVDDVIACVRKGAQARVTAALVSATRGRMSESIEGQPGKPDDLAVIVYRRPPPAR